MICSNCGKEIPDGSLFCSACGAETEYGVAAEPVRTKPPVAAGPWKLLAPAIAAVLAAALVASLLFALLPRHQKSPEKLFGVCDLDFEGYTYNNLESYAESRGLVTDKRYMGKVSVAEVYVALINRQDAPVTAEQMLAEYYVDPLTIDGAMQNAKQTEILLEQAKEQQKADKKKDKADAGLPGKDETSAVNPLPTFWLCMEDDTYLMEPEGYYPSGNVCPWIPKDAVFPEGEEPQMCELGKGQYISLVLGAAGEFDEEDLADSYVAVCYGDEVYYWDLDGRMETGKEIDHELGYYYALYGDYAEAAFVEEKDAAPGQTGN